MATAVRKSLKRNSGTDMDRRDRGIGWWDRERKKAEVEEKRGMEIKGKERVRG